LKKSLTKVFIGEEWMGLKDSRYQDLNRDLVMGPLSPAQGVGSSRG
jgi:hypothetical protein